MLIKKPTFKNDAFLLQFTIDTAGASQKGNWQYAGSCVLEIDAKRLKLKT